MPEFCRLPESELDVMLAVWKQGGEASAPEIGESLGRALTASALHSYLKRLEEKGFLRCRKAGKLNIYTALVSEADYRRAESGAVLEKLYGGSLKAFAAALWDGGRLSGDDVRDLRSYLEELERRDP
jgi:BlaI family penicillinase repressor|nr:BlaI/MecI/CopY family transcriptional regulator [uncultured Oscillibacter sp.]